jgi:hypothetical protein
METLIKKTQKSINSVFFLIEMHDFGKWFQGNNNQYLLVKQYVNYFKGYMRIFEFGFRYRVGLMRGISAAK